MYVFPRRVIRTRAGRVSTPEEADRRQGKEFFFPLLPPFLPPTAYVHLLRARWTGTVVGSKEFLSTDHFRLFLPLVPSRFLSDVTAF